MFPFIILPLSYKSNYLIFHVEVRLENAELLYKNKEEKPLITETKPCSQ